MERWIMVQRRPSISPLGPLDLLPGVALGILLGGGLPQMALAAQGAPAAPPEVQRMRGGDPLLVAPLDPTFPLLELLVLQRGELPPPIELRGIRLAEYRDGLASVGAAEEGAPGLLGRAILPDVGSMGWGGGLALDGGWSGREASHPGDPGGTSLALRGRGWSPHRGGFTLEAELREPFEGDGASGSGVGAAELLELSTTLTWGGALLTLGRTRPRLGPGRDALLLAGARPLDGIGVANRDPQRLPGFLAGLGEISFSGSIQRVRKIGEVSDPWYGTLGMTLDPTPSWRMGAIRTAAFGGEGLPPVTWNRVWGVLSGQHSTHSGEFEDQYAELFTRVVLRPGGRPLSLYLSVAVNDTEGAIRDDPAFLAGALFSLAPPGWMGGVRYEYVAFGAEAGLCVWCGGGRPRTWFRHYVFGAHQVEGGPLGSSLGGYGSRHLLLWQGWSASGRWSAMGELAHTERAAGNLFEEEWLGREVQLLLGLGLSPIPAVTVDLTMGVRHPEAGDRRWAGGLRGSWMVGLWR